MEHIIHLLIGFIVLSFLLKTGFYPRWGIWLSALVYTVFLICIGPWATEQSPTEINSLLASAPHILPLSVYVTLEASIMIAFCFNCFADTSKQRTLFQRTVTYILNFYPGLLMAGILTYLLIQLFFAFPGVSFGLITGISSVAVFILISGLSLLLKNIVGERKLRLEILFITNLFIVLLSVVSTGNN